MRHMVHVPDILTPVHENKMFPFYVLKVLIFCFKLCRGENINFFLQKRNYRTCTTVINLTRWGLNPFFNSIWIKLHFININARNSAIYINMQSSNFWTHPQPNSAFKQQEDQNYLKIYCLIVQFLFFFLRNTFKVFHTICVAVCRCYGM